MIASLPMYDRPETKGANDQLWELVRREIGVGPKELIRGNDPWHDWASPDLILSQTCGLPFRMSLHKRVHLVATPDHRLEGCAAGQYRSALVRRREDENRAPDISAMRFAYNAKDSQSGWAAAWYYSRDNGLDLNLTLETGSHVASAKAVAAGLADFAALDAVTWDMIKEWDEFAPTLCAFDWTVATPALPFVTAQADLVTPLRAALDQAIHGLSPMDRARLRLYGVVDVPKDEYLQLPLPPDRH